MTKLSLATLALALSFALPAVAQDVSVSADVSVSTSVDVSVSTPDLSSSSEPVSSISSELSSELSSVSSELSSELSGEMSSSMLSSSMMSSGFMDDCDNLDIAKMSLTPMEASALEAVTSVTVFAVDDCSGLGGLAAIDGSVVAALTTNMMVSDALTAAGRPGAEIIAYSLDDTSLTVYVRSND